MSKREPLHLSVAQCVDHIVETFGRDIRIAMPLGLGKPIPLINALYQRARKDSSIELTIFTALSLEKPVWTNPLERRLLRALRRAGVGRRARPGVPARPAPGRGAAQRAHPRALLQGRRLQPP